MATAKTLKIVPTQDDALGALVAQRKALDEQIKAAKAAEKAKRAEQFDHAPIAATRNLLPRVARRIKAGATLEAAVDAELELCRAALIAKLSA